MQTDESHSDANMQAAVPQNLPDEEGSDDSDAVMPFKYSITAYGMDYPVDALVKRINSKHIIIPRITGVTEKSIEVNRFQRDFVWTKETMDKFVESLLLGLPVPGIFFGQGVGQSALGSGRATATGNAAEVLRFRNGPQAVSTSLRAGAFQGSELQGTGRGGPHATG